jgi:hypothetical protein
MYLGCRIRAAHAPLDRSAMPIQQPQHRVLVPLSCCGMSGRHLDDGDQEQLSRQILLTRRRHPPTVFHRNETITLGMDARRTVFGTTGCRPDPRAVTLRSAGRRQKRMLYGNR